MPNITLPIYVLEFEPPLQGFDGEFNTFRLGWAWAKRVKRGRHVLLMNSKTKEVFGRARVLNIWTGTLLDLATMMASRNHNQLGKAPSEATSDLMGRMRDRYGPHIARDDKRCTVILMRRRD